MTARQSKALGSGRTVLILGVIAYHAARVFDQSPFYVKTPTPLESLAPVMLFGALLGMPLFFAFAGLSIWHSLRARGAQRFIGERAGRLLAPFLAGVVLLVPLQVFVARRAGGEDLSYMSNLRTFFDVHFTPQFPIPVSGTWFDLAHLWFLGYLFAFTILLLPGLLWLQRRPALPVLKARGAAAIWILSALGVVAVETILGTEAAGGWNRWTYLVFLALGVSIAIQPAVAGLVARRWRMIFVAAVASFVALAVACQQLGGEFSDSLTSGSALAPMLWRAGKGLTMMLFLMAVVGSVVDHQAAPARSGRTTAFLSFLGPISLPLYIVHQVILVALAYWIVSWSVPVAAQWLVLVLLTVGLSIASVELAARTRFGRLMLGMKPGRRSPIPAPNLRPERRGDLDPLPTT